MALIKWLTVTDKSCLQTLMHEQIADLGMVIDPLVSNSQQVYAVKSSVGEISRHSRVKLIASWTDRSTGEFQIEVLSDEPLLLQETQCKRMAAALRRAFPPK